MAKAQDGRRPARMPEGDDQFSPDEERLAFLQAKRGLNEGEVNEMGRLVKRIRAAAEQVAEQLG